MNARKYFFQLERQMRYSGMILTIIHVHNSVCLDPEEVQFPFVVMMAVMLN
jgi:hypothetical protein